MEELIKVKEEFAKLAQIISEAIPNELKSTTHLNILAAAIYLIGTKGIDATTIDEVAQVAGVGKGTVFLYFPDKKTLVIEALKTTLEVIYYEIIKETSPYTEPIDKLQAQITIMSNLVLSNKHSIFFELYRKCKPSICYSEEWMDVIKNWDKIRNFTLECVEQIGKINNFDEETNLMLTIIMLAPFLFTMFMMSHNIQEEKFKNILQLIPKYFHNIEKMLNLKRGGI